MRHLLCLLLGGVLFLPACDRPPAIVARPAEPTIYEACGVIAEVRPRRAIIAHEAIPGFMEAMTMEFATEREEELAGLQPGDVIAFRLHVAADRSWIDRVKKTGAAPPPALAEPRHDAPPAMLPNAALVDSAGTAFHLADFHGRALAFTFIFTRCPLPDFCPRLNAHFATIQRTLAATAGWHLLSISLDPAYDTPARLTAYAAGYAPDPARWTFATGPREEIDRLGAAFGLEVARAGALPEHNLRTVVVDPAGRIRRVFTGNTWTAEDLATELQRALDSAR